MSGRKGFVNGVYVIQVYGFPKMRYFFYTARQAEKEYRNAHNLKGKHINWNVALY